MEKILVKEFYYYGKSDSGVLQDAHLIDDTAEARKNLLDDLDIEHHDVLLKSQYDDFVFQGADSLLVPNDGGDWDEPTSLQLVIYTKDELLTEAQYKYDSALHQIKEWFKEG